MPDHDFTLILAREPSGDELDALFDAGCDDAMFGTTAGVAHAQFDREADTLADAIMSAIESVESVAGLRVVRVEPDDPRTC